MALSAALVNGNEKAAKRSWIFHFIRQIPIQLFIPKSLPPLFSASKVELVSVDCFGVKARRAITQALSGQRYPVPLKYFKILLLVIAGQRSKRVR